MTPTRAATRADGFWQSSPKWPSRGTCVRDECEWSAQHHSRFAPVRRANWVCSAFRRSPGHRREYNWEQSRRAQPGARPGLVTTRHGVRPGLVKITTREYIQSRTRLIAFECVVRAKTAGGSMTVLRYTYVLAIIITPVSDLVLSLIARAGVTHACVISFHDS